MGASIGNVQMQLDKEREQYEGTKKDKGTTDQESAKMHEEYKKMMRDLKNPLIWSTYCDFDFLCREMYNQDPLFGLSDVCYPQII